MSAYHVPLRSYRARGRRTTRERRASTGPVLKFELPPLQSHVILRLVARSAEGDVEHKTRKQWRRHGSNGALAGRYVPAFSWHGSIGEFVEEIVTEAPLLHVCSGPVSDFGDIRVDRYVRPTRPGVIADWMSLPFAPNSFGAVFADPPWSVGYMADCARFCKEALRVAPVAYVMSPWLWVNKGSVREKIWVREFPGVNVPILVVKYTRTGMLI